MKIWGFIVIVVLSIVAAGLVILSNQDKPSLDVYYGDNVSIMMVSGTEYLFGDEGQVIVDLRNKDFEPIAAVCQVSVLYPDKSYFIDHESMTDSTVFGTQFKNFTIPRVEGVYEYSVNCSYNTKEYIVGKSFHVKKVGIKAWVEK
jgi:hypothetical protein